MEVPDLEARIGHILTNRLGLASSEIRHEARLVEDLGLDSLDAVELAIATERQFNVAVSEEQVAQLKTVADIVALVQRLLSDKGNS